MTTFVSRGKTGVVTSGTTWAATANLTDGTPPANPATYATWTSIVSAAVGYIEVSGFDFSTLPYGATITSVTMTVRHLVSSAAVIPTITYQAYLGATPIGSPTAGTATTAAHDDTVTFAITEAQLRAGTLKVRATATRAAVTTSAVWSVDHIDVTVNMTMPKIATLVDSFDTALDRTTMTKWPSTSSQTIWEAGRVKIPVVPSYYNLATYNSGGYDLTGSSVYARIYPPPVGNGSREMFFEIIRGGVTVDKLSFYVNGSPLSLNARRTVNSVNTAGPSLTYDPVAHAWLRIRESAGTAYFDTSPDGTTWTNFWSIAPGFDITNILLNITTGYWSTEVAADAFVDNVNVVPVSVGRPKVWSGTAWVAKPLKVWNGTAHVEKPMKVWTGSAWKTAT